MLPGRYAKLVGRESAPTSDEETGSNSETETLAEQKGKSDGDPSMGGGSRQQNKAEEAGISNDASNLDTQHEPGSHAEKPSQFTTAGIIDPEKGRLAEVQEAEVGNQRRNPYVVDWYFPDDPQNPRNVRSL